MYRIMISSIVVMLRSTLVSGLACAEVRSEDQFAVRFDLAVVRAVDGPIGWTEARNTLKNLSGERVVPALVDALQEDARFNDRKLRNLAYTVLAHHGAAGTELGYRQLLVGMDEPDIGSLCVDAIAQAPVRKHSEIVTLVAKRLGDGSYSQGWKTAAIRTLDRLGAPASTELPQIAAVFSNQEYDAQLRLAACLFMLRFGGLDYALTRFDDLDRDGEIVALGSLARYITQIDEAFYRERVDPGDEFRQKRAGARAFVIKALGSPHQKVRAAALECFGAILGEDSLVFGSPNEYEWNPQIKKALENMADNDADEHLRAVAAKVLETDIHAMARRIERMRRYHSVDENGKR